MVEIIKTEALVIHSMRWRDTSKIVHLFTSDKGYVKVIARGAMRPKSPFRGVLENLNHCEVVFTVKESRGLQMLTQVSLIKAFNRIRENLDATAIAFSILELIKSLVHYNESAQSLFHYTISSLSALNENSRISPLLFLQQYLIFLGEYLGFGWTLDVCRECEKPPRKFPVRVDVANGAIICPDCARLTNLSSSLLDESQWKLMFKLQQLEPQQLLEPGFEMADQRIFAGLTNLLLAHLNYHTEQTLQLKSLKMYMT